MLPVELNSFLQNVTYELLHFFWIGNVHQFRLDVDYGYRSHKKKNGLLSDDNFHLFNFVIYRCSISQPLSFRCFDTNKQN